MNKRIREMALEAGLYYHPHGTCCMDEMFPFHFNPAEADKAYGKFAELIVRECAETVQDFVDHRFPASEYPDRLKRYFGVAERVSVWKDVCGND